MIATLLLSNVNICLSETSEIENLENEENAALYAISFINTVFCCPDYEAGDVLTFNDENDEISGYCIDILLNGEDYGYVIVKISNGEPIVEEFSVCEGAINPFDLIIQKMDVSCEDASDDSLTLYSVGMNEYQIYNNNEDLVYEYGGFIINESEFEDEKEAERDKYDFEKLSQNDERQITVNSSIPDGEEVITGTYSGTVSDSYTIAGATKLSYYGTSNVSNINKTYACAVVALCNLMQYYRSQGYTKIETKLTTLYEELWDYAGTKSDGSTPVANIGTAATKYLSSVGYDCTCFNFTSYANFRINLKSERPCIFSYGALFDGEKKGHSVFVVGYVTTSTAKYLRIADGWSKILKFINYSGYEYTFVKGQAFSMS